jgi:hypothetical protein
VCGVPANAINIIESIQPFHTRYEVLNVLDLLVRLDKHRMLLLCAAHVWEVGNILWFKKGKLIWKGSGSGMGINLAAFGPAFTEEGAIDVKVEGEPTILVTIQDVIMPSGHIIILPGVLTQIVECLKDIVPRFDRFFV